MDATSIAQELFASVPAHDTAQIEVVEARDGRGQVTADVPHALTNIIGSLHSSGLVALVDAAGLAAIIGSCDKPEDFDGVIPLGTAASLEFLAPARGRVTATCLLTEENREALTALLARRIDRTRLMTSADVRDAAGKVVCRGSFQWSIRRSASANSDTGS